VADETFRRFLYFLPAADPADVPERLDAIGLGPIFDGVVPDCRGCSTGPDGGPGQVVVLPAPRNMQAQPLGYFPEQQLWTEDEGYWLGCVPDALPRPLELAVVMQQPGHLFKLADGNHWLVPVLRRCDLAGGHDIGVQLPRKLTIGDDGVWTTEPIAEHQALAVEIESTWSAFSDFCLGEVGTLDDSTWPDLATRGIGVNYRVGRREVAYLGLLTTSNLEDVIGILLDVPTLFAVARAQIGEAGQKKTAAPSSGSDTECGEKDDPAAPPMPGSNG